MQTDKQKMTFGSPRSFTGVVVSDAQQKTRVVRVDQSVVHPIYHKRYIKSRKFQVHDEKEETHVGDSVTFVETRPYSKTKRWRVVSKKTIS